MATWLIVAAAVYLIVVLGFFAAIVVEVNKRGIELSAPHFIVPLIWPLWAIWYGYMVLSDWWKGK